MTARDTSMMAHDELVQSGKLGRQASLIVEFIRARGGDWSLQEISRGTGLPINAVSGRCFDCKKAGALVEGEVRKCRVTGKTIHPVKLPGGQLGLGIAA